MSIHQYWVAYDLSDDRERVRVERCVSRYGERLQKSLFVCVLDMQRHLKLQGELEALRCSSGSVVLAPITNPAKVLTIGQQHPCLHEDWVFGLFSASQQSSDMLRGDA